MERRLERQYWLWCTMRTSSSVETRTRVCLLSQYNLSYTWQVFEPSVLVPPPPASPISKRWEDQLSDQAKPLSSFKNPLLYDKPRWELSVCSNSFMIHSDSGEVDYYLLLTRVLSLLLSVPALERACDGKLQELPGCDLQDGQTKIPTFLARWSFVITSVQ